MSRVHITLGLVTACILVFGGIALALDAPHDASANVGCNSCHIAHNALGPGLTRDTNANLCLSCHKAGGLASSKPLSSSMQAVPKVSGSSHRWDAAMPATSGPANQYGLRAVADLADAGMKAALTNSGGVVTCSVCHQQHDQLTTPWDPNAPATAGSSGRHFLRVANDYNQLCEDCHYYRTPASTQTSPRVYTGNPISHPVAVNVAGASYHAVPLEPQAASWTPQAGTRYALNGGTDTNPTNNLVMDTNTQIRCLTCHGVHYSDSRASTIDQP